MVSEGGVRTERRETASRSLWGLSEGKTDQEADHHGAKKEKEGMTLSYCQTINCQGAEEMNT